MEYQSPGGAFTNGINDMLMQQANQKRQAMLDSLNAKKEADLAQYHQQELEAGKAALEEKRAEHAQIMDDRKRKGVLDTIGGMVEGDVPSQQLLDDAQRMGIPIRSKNAPPPTLAGTAVAPGLGAPASAVGQPITPEEPPSSIAAPLPQVYAGSKQEMEAKAARQRQQDYVNGLPEGPLKADANFGMHMGRNPVASTVAPPKGDMQVPVMTREAALAAGQIPQNTRVMEPLQPRDTSAATDRAEALKESKLQTVREHANKRLYDEMGKAELSKIVASSDLSMALAQNTNTADAVIAPLVLKATISSGGGSGFRMTRPEIDNVTKNTRSGWESLTLTLNKWMNDGGVNPDGTPNAKVPLILTDAQRTEMKQMARAIRKKAASANKDLLDAEDAITTATSNEEINRIVTKTKRKYLGDDEADSADSASMPAVAPKRIMYDNNGKQVK